MRTDMMLVHMTTLFARCAALSLSAGGGGGGVFTCGAHRRNAFIMSLWQLQNGHGRDRRWRRRRRSAADTEQRTQRHRNGRGMAIVVAKQQSLFSVHGGRSCKQPRCCCSARQDQACGQVTTTNAYTSAYSIRDGALYKPLTRHSGFVHSNT